MNTLNVHTSIFAIYVVEIEGQGGRATPLKKTLKICTVYDNKLKSYFQTSWKECVWNANNDISIVWEIKNF